MCGICGVWEYGASDGRIDPSLIARMRDEMTHRGPDDSGERRSDDPRVAEEVNALTPVPADKPSGIFMTARANRIGY